MPGDDLGHPPAHPDGHLLLVVPAANGPRRTKALGAQDDFPECLAFLDRAVSVSGLFKR
jgi:hypothetical protein